MLDVIKSPTLDYYLVLTGPKGALAPSKGMCDRFASRRCTSFNLRTCWPLEATGVKVGVATNVRVAQWNAAEIYPRATNPALILTDRQRAQLAMFRSD